MTHMNNASSLHSLLPTSRNLTLASPWISEGCRPDIFVQTSCDRMHIPFLESVQHCWPSIAMGIYNSRTIGICWYKQVCLFTRGRSLWIQRDEKQWWKPSKDGAFQINGNWLEFQLYKHFSGRTRQMVGLNSRERKYNITNPGISCLL